MTPRMTGTRMHKARTVWRHYFFQACASFALYQVDCPAADKRAARAGSAVISALVLADVSLCERNCAQAACGRFCTPRRACLKDACAPCEAMAQQRQGGQPRWPRSTLPLGAALFVLARSQQGKRPRPRRNMQVRASHRPALQPSDMCQTPERAAA